MLEVSTTVRVDFKMESVLVHFRKNPNSKMGRNGKKTPRIFRFVTLPVEIPDKMKFHPWKFYKFLLHPLLFYWPLEFPHSIFLITLELSCPQPSPVWMFSEIDRWKSGEKKIYIYIYSIYSIYIANEVMEAATVDSW